MNSPTISPILAFSDNYIWLIAKGDLAYVVDPGDPEPVTRALEATQLRLAGILVTHHHYDHTGAVEVLQQQTECDVWGPPDSPAGPYQHTVAEGDTVSVLGVDFEVLAVRGTLSITLLITARLRRRCSVETPFLWRLWSGV